MLSVQELYDLHNEVSERIGSDGLLELLSYANRIDGLEDLLESIGLKDLLYKDEIAVIFKRRVLVLGQSNIKADKLKSLIRNNSHLEPEDFEFCLEYDQVKRFNFRRLRGSETFGAVVVGPQPHSTPGKLDSSSAISEMEKHPEMYPIVIRCTNERGELEISKNSFKNALEALEDLAS